MQEESKLQQFFDECPSSVSLADGFQLNWSREGIGFGEFYFYTDPETNTIKCDNEIMSKGFIKSILNQMVNECVLTCPSSKEPVELDTTIQYVTVKDKECIGSQRHGTDAMLTFLTPDDVLHDFHLTNDQAQQLISDLTKAVNKNIFS